MLKVVLRIGAGALLASASHQAIAQSADWTVSEARGPVTIVSAQGREAATRGAGINPGDTVITGPGGRAVLVHKKDFVTVAANSRIRIPSENAGSGITRFFQEIGNAIFNVEKRGTPHFSVDTPFLAAVVKGTVFSVSVNAGSTALQVTEGVVEVATTDGGARDLVRPGSIAMIAAGDRYRLTISGDRAATIDSPARTSAAAPTMPDAAPAAPAEQTSDPRENPAPASEKVSAEAGEMVNVRIEEAVVSKPVDLATATNGILTGLSPVSFAANVGLTKAVAETTTRETPPSGMPIAKPEVANSDAGRPTPAVETINPAGPEKASTGKPADSSILPNPANKPDADTLTDKGKDKPDTDKPDGDDKGRDTPGTDKPDGGDKGKDKPDTGKPDGGDKGKDKPDTDKPDGGDKGKDTPGTGKPDGGDKGKDKSDTDKPDGGDKGKDKPDTGKPDSGDKGKDTLGTDKPDGGDKGKNKPDTGKPDGGDKGKDTPGTGTPDGGDKGKDKPDTDKPDGSDKGKDTPGTDKPDGGDKGKDKPDTDKPDGGDKGKDKPDTDKPDGGDKGKDKPDAEKPDVGGKSKIKLLIDKLVGGLEREVRSKISKGGD